MTIVDLHELLEKVLQRNQLPGFISGLLLGVFTVLVILRLTNRRRRSGLVPELRDQIGVMTAEIRGLKEESEGLKQQVEGLVRERNLLTDKVIHQEGQIDAFREKAVAISNVCERLQTELFDSRTYAPFFPGISAI
jgi:hypothetical protein